MVGLGGGGSQGATRKGNIATLRYQDKAFGCRKIEGMGTVTGADGGAWNDVEPKSARRSTWREWYGWWIAAGTGIYLVLGGTLLVVLPDRLLANWFPDLSEQERAAHLGPAANAVLFALGGVIAVVGVGLSLSRHRQELKAAARDIVRLRDDQLREQARRDEASSQRRVETERALRERFVTTVNLLSDAAPINRQAALFALGALADDWDSFGKSDEVQVCIEVLAGYLRAPRSPEMLLPLSPEEQRLGGSDRGAAQRTAPQEVSVRQAGYTVIRNHLREGANHTWIGRQVNLSGAEIDFMVMLQGVTIGRGGHLNFARSKVFGSGNIHLGGARVVEHGILNFGGAEVFDGAQLFLGKSDISDQGLLNFRSARIAEGSEIFLRASTVGSGGQLNFMKANIESERTVPIASVELTRGGYVIRPDGRHLTNEDDAIAQ